MAADYVFTQSEEEKIDAKPTRWGKCEELLEILPRKGNMRLVRDENSEKADKTRQAPDSTENEELREEVVIDKRCMAIQEDAGACWQDLGVVLELPEGELHNIGKDFQYAKEKGLAVLKSGRNKRASKATEGCLFDAFESNGQKRIAENFLELYRAKR
ncbi:uncharacterized protein LOC111326334 [Stylophora pistillata]|nr:uncharacterized protein LOC111326334 [Stylophora pistillata]